MSNKAKIREESVKMNPIHDVMFSMMARDRGFCQEILRVILNDPALELIGDPVVQYHLPNPMGRKVTLDALCKLGDGRTVAIEVQKNTEPDPQRRVRFESGLLISRLIDPNTPFKDVEDVVFVYISGFDPFDLGKSVYYIDRIVRGLGNVVYNGFEEVYVNAAVKDGTDVAELMKVFTEDAAYDDRFPITSEIKRRFKLTEEGRQEMTAELEKMMDEERKEAEELGIEKGRVSELIDLVTDGILTIAQAANRLGETEQAFSRRLSG